jgi:4-hydroxymandelate oxidase
VPVLVDGGIRDGADVLTARALATGGADGVRDCLDFYREDLARTMAQAGLATLVDIDGTMVSPVTHRPQIAINRHLFG